MSQIDEILAATHRHLASVEAIGRYAYGVTRRYEELTRPMREAEAAARRWQSEVAGVSAAIQNLGCAAAGMVGGAAYRDALIGRNAITAAEQLCIGPSVTYAMESYREFYRDMEQAARRSAATYPTFYEQISRPSAALETVERIGRLESGALAAVPPLEAAIRFDFTAIERGPSRAALQAEIDELRASNEALTARVEELEREVPKRKPDDPDVLDYGNGPYR